MGLHLGWSAATNKLCSRLQERDLELYGPCQNQSKRHPSRPLPILLTCAPSPLLCAERCQQPQWDSQLQFSPNQSFYWVSEEVTLSCFMNNTPPLAMIRCENRTTPRRKDAWEVKDIQGTWHRLAENLTCTMGKLRTSRSPLINALSLWRGPGHPAMRHLGHSSESGPTWEQSPRWRGLEAFSVGLQVSSVPASPPNIFPSCISWGS